MSKMARQLWKTFLRRSSTTPSNQKYQNSLKGKNFLEPMDFSDDELKSLFWTATDLKLQRDNEYNLSNAQDLKTATLLLSEANIHFQCALQNAANFLNVKLKVVVDPKWEQWHYPQDVGRILGKSCDVIFIKNVFHSKVQDLARGTEDPIINLSDRRFANLRALSDIFTIREQFGYLENLHICWIGAPTSLINTYLLLMPRFGVKMKYFCCHLFEKVTPILLSLARKQGPQFEKNCKEAQSFEEALSHSKILAMGADTGGYKQINDKNCTAADHDFYILHSMPRHQDEVCPKLFQSGRNLTWASYENYQWLLAAFLLRSLTDYEHVTKPLNYAEIKGVKDSK